VTANVDAIIGLVLATVGATGVHLLVGVLHGPRGSIDGRARVQRRERWRARFASMGLDHVRPVETLGVMTVLAVLGGLLGHATYGGVWAAVVAAGVAASIPVASARARRRTRLVQARDSWPRMIEEIRLQVVSLGRSVPQALLDVGTRAPAEMRPAFVDARREWLMSTDFDRTLAVIRGGLAESTADAVCETLLIAHETGGTDVDARLRELIEDRILDAQERRDARARQAGVRFSRFFVLLVPLGMALVGLAIGDGRAAYATPGGQAAVVLAFALMAGCWWWAGRLLRLPDEQRVFSSSARDLPR
jgi:tight adherence protein B